ncbi:hypothetical protein QS257_12940 [Terrilactibacillus sp. S3-3]|nr:hypothetical protein QS257_12940 [Terrilactibacillus sp. S3-3]
MFNTVSVDVLEDYIGSHVKINIGGPESREGILLAIKSDYLVLLTKSDGVVYYQTSHIKGASVDTEEEPHSLAPDVSFLKFSTFERVLEALRYKKVKVNRGGPESIEGVLNEIKDDTLILTVKDTLVFITIFHIKSISRVFKKPKPAKDDSSDDKSSDDKSSDQESSKEDKSSEDSSSDKNSSENSDNEKDSQNNSDNSQNNNDNSQNNSDNSQNNSENNNSESSQSSEQSSNNSSNRMRGYSLGRYFRL